MKGNRKIAYFLGGAIVGGVTGVVVTSLFAPNNEQENREKIKDTYLIVNDKITDSISTGKTFIDEGLVDRAFLDREMKKLDNIRHNAVAKSTTETLSENEDSVEDVIQPT